MNAIKINIPAGSQKGTTGDIGIYKGSSDFSGVRIKVPFSDEVVYKLLLR